MFKAWLRPSETSKVLNKYWTTVLIFPFCLRYVCFGKMRCQLTDTAEMFWETRTIQVTRSYNYLFHLWMSQQLSPLRTAGTDSRLDRKGKEEERRLEVLWQWGPYLGCCGKRMLVKPWHKQSLLSYAAVAHSGNFRRPGQRWSKVMIVLSPWGWLPQSPRAALHQL